MENKLDLARKKINEIDAEMARLFEERMKASEEVAEYKKAHGMPIYDPSREAEVISRGSLAVSDEGVREYYVSFLKETMSLSRAYQSRLLTGMRIAYCGTEGAFAHIAACELFPSAEKIAYDGFDTAYAAVERGECDACVLPIENSYNGEVGQVCDLMFSGSLFVNGIKELMISQDLLAPRGATLEDIKEVVSHPQALGQCAEFIKQHGFEKKEYSNTALAARYVKEKGDKTIGAIASAKAASIFDLDVLVYNINASQVNTTRFAVFSRIRKKCDERRMGNHSIILFTVKHEAGALAKAIEIIGRHGFNMKALKSRPMKELLWQYYFYVEAEGNIDTPDAKLMLDELRKYCDKLKVAGTFIKEN